MPVATKPWKANERHANRRWWFGLLTLFRLAPLMLGLAPLMLGLAPQRLRR
jgi:hypothetical protein